MTTHTGTEISSLRIGTVTAVRGRRIEITVDVDKNDSSLIFQGEIISNVSIGSFLIVRRGYAHLAVQVEEEELIENNAWEKSTYQRDVDRNTRILKTTLLGEFQTDTSISPFQTRFVSGTQTSPLIGNIAYLASAEQASKIYVSTSKPDTQITIGHLATNSSIPINIDISTFFSSHIGIFGNTGSGKSYTLTQLYTRLFDILSRISEPEKQLENSKFIFFDFNGEYSSSHLHNIICDSGLKVVYGSRGNKDDKNEHEIRRIPLDSRILYSDKFWIDILEAAEQAQQLFIINTLNDLQDSDELYWIVRSLVHTFLTDKDSEHISTQILFSFLFDIHRILNFNNPEFLSTLSQFADALHFHQNKQMYEIQAGKDRAFSDTLPFKHQVDDYLDELFSTTRRNKLNTLRMIRANFKVHHFIEILSNSNVAAHMRPLMTRFDSTTDTLRKWFTFMQNSSKYSKTVQIINLQNASLEEQQLIPLITARASYDQHKVRTKATKQPHYLNIIIEEAHNILSQTPPVDSDFSQYTRIKTFEEIVKEGRKFGVFLTVISQRPADIAPTIVSQLHHYFLHRLGSLADLECVKNSVLFFNRNLFEAIPSLSCGTCIISGTSVQIPAVVKIDELPEDRRPDNETIDLVKLWGLDSGPAGEGDSDSSVSTSARAESAADSDSTRASDT